MITFYKSRIHKSGNQGVEMAVAPLTYLTVAPNNPVDFGLCCFKIYWFPRKKSFSEWSYSP